MKNGLLMLVAFLLGIAVKGVAQTGSEYSSCFPTVVSPANGETINKLESVVLSFPYDVNVNTSAKCSVISADEGASADVIALARLSLSPDGDYSKVILTLHNTVIESLGTYRVIIPAEAIWEADNESHKSLELSYTYKVDPDYWDPDWVIEVGANCTQTAPCQLNAGFKYNFTQMYSYMQFTATESGRLYFTFVDGKDNYSLWAADSEWNRIGELGKTTDGVSWIGVEAGKTYNITNYSFYQRVLKVTFEPGNQYETLQSIGVFPAQGGLYSTSIPAPKSNKVGAVEFYFSTKVNKDELKVYVILPSKDNKKIEVTGDVTFTEGIIDYGETPAYLAVMISNTITKIKSEYDLKADDPIQIMLEDVQDVNYASNKLAEPLTLDLILAATVCVSVNPNPKGKISAMPTELSLRFDGNVVCNNGKGCIVDVKSGERQEFAIEGFKCEFVGTIEDGHYEATIALPVQVKKFASKQFCIEIEGLVDDDGHVVSYGNEIGKFVLNYCFSDASFNYVSANPADGSELTSIKTTKLTFGDEVHIGPEPTAYLYYGDDGEVTGKFTVDPTDPKSVIITWPGGFTQPGRYSIRIDEGAIYDSGYDANKEDFGLADGAYCNPDFYLEYTISANLSSTTVANITPEPYGAFGGLMEELPAEVVIEFNGGVKDVKTVYGQAATGGGWAADAVLPEGAVTLAYRLDGNKMILTLPVDEVANILYGSYTVTADVVGEDDKPVGYAFDSRGNRDMFSEHISFSYQIQRLLKVESSMPLNSSKVNKLDTVILTFNEELAEYGKDYDSPCLLNVEDDSKVADFTYIVSGNQLILTLAEPIVAKGSYAVCIPKLAVGSVSELYNEEDIYVFIDVDPDYMPDELLSIVSVTPENGTTVENLTTVEFKLNKEVGYLYQGMLIPADGGDDAAYASLSLSESVPTSYTLDFTLQSENGVALRKGVTYTMTLEAWASEDAFNRNQGTPEIVTLTYVGDSEGVQYSDVTLVSITPVEGTVISDKSQNKFVLKFSGAVNMVEGLTFINMGQGVTEKFESIVANADKTEYTLIIADNVMDGLTVSINIVFAAEDLTGKHVRGNDGDVFAYEYALTAVDGIKGVEADADVEVTVYNVTGVKVAQGKASEVLKKLSKGLYIVNGKKTVVK